MFSIQGRRNAFTLIELLVVIAIIAILIALLVPAVQKVRESAARTQCINNLKQQGLAFHAYHDTFRKFPSGWNGTAGDPFQYTTWQLRILPYLEQTSLYSKTEAWLKTSPGFPWVTANPSIGAVIPIFVCPSNARPTTVNYSGVTITLSSYLGNAGTISTTWTANGVLFAGSQLRIGDIQDGTSNTILVSERPVTGDLYAGWTFGAYGFGYGDGDCVLGARDTAVASSMGDVATNIGLKAPTSPNNTAELDGAHWWSYHTGGVNVLLCDGSVQFLTYSADAVLPQMSTRALGEVFNTP